MIVVGLIYIAPNVINDDLIKEKFSVLFIINIAFLVLQLLIGTQLLIAVKSYKAKTGELPRSLDELVPEYFPEVPIDPFDGKPIRYSAEKKIIYSVGLDSKNIDRTEERFTIKIEF